jgi:N-[(2S)-2-amino-2-carboxyethyl]-L-glutamate dehydrogenase
MKYDDIILLKGDLMVSLFQGRELEILQAIKSAYQIHAQGDSSLPHSNFLRFPNNEKDRIIALPAYLGGDADIAGLKWIASFRGLSSIGTKNRDKDSKLLETRFRSGFLHEEANFYLVY